MSNNKVKLSLTTYKKKFQPMKAPNELLSMEVR